MNDLNAFELPKTYESKITDSKWYDFWEKSGFFQADADSKKPPYVIVMPPPNVTGVLHMGHALVNTLQDVLIRWKRMSGYEALWVPGTDHAGIATQAVVERHLIKTEGKRREQFSRDEFIDRVWEWKEKSETTILHQLKQLGASCDWSRLRFTMDEGCNQAVRTLFKKLFDEGLIYRGDYLVNWDPITQTALADDEVEYEEHASHLWFFKYHLVDESGYVQIATTRPETMLGDTAIAVSPRDPRYQHLIGKKVRLPILNREIPIIADHHVDPEFGTGMVKITPAHDPNDYRLGLDHGLDFINILTPDGRINENGGPFRGLSREEARGAIVAEMKELGLLERVEDHLLRVGVSYRSKAVIEPYLSKQWFVKMGSFTSELKSAIVENEVKILPKSWEHTYFHWIDNLRDWCISRQLWWGHRIPVWYRKGHPDTMICHDGPGLPPEVAKEPEMWSQDPDVLDTWFSSALWPESTLGWPEKTKDFEKFYPTDVIVTGHDILFFWVARMLLIGKYVTGQYPFPEVFLHGLIYGKSYWTTNKEGAITYITGSQKKEYDLGKPLPSTMHSKWEKLSKSKGNVIDPLDLIEEYGTDAMRMSLCACANQSPQIDLDRRRFEEFKNFTNKVWNGARFIFMNLEGLTSKLLQEGLDLSLLHLEDKWIISSLNKLNRESNQYLEKYAFDQAALSPYEFFWNKFCAFYLEIVKPTLFGKVGSQEEKQNKQKLLVIVLCNMVRLMHPMAPFITEELFQLLKKRFPDLSATRCDPYTNTTIEALQAPACMVAPYPKEIVATDINPAIEAQFTLAENIVYKIRNMRAQMKIPPQLSIKITLSGAPLAIFPIVQALIKNDLIEEVPFAISESIRISITPPKEFLENERIRLQKEEEKLMENIGRLRETLANPEFLEKAKPELIEKKKLSLSQTEEELTLIKEKANSSGEDSADAYISMPKV